MGFCELLPAKVLRPLRHSCVFQQQRHRLGLEYYPEDVFLPQNYPILHLKDNPICILKIIICYFMGKNGNFLR